MSKSNVHGHRFRSPVLAQQARVKTATLLAMMRGPRIKAADAPGGASNTSAGGPGSDPSGGGEASFEQAFASLAYTYTKDKAPRLLDYLIGFQLVERDDDKTKAVGMFGFKVGQQWLYAPVFFLNGQMKGHELLYLKGQDQFVPLKENWVNHVLAKRPHVLGEPEHRNLQQLGVMQPNLYRLSVPPYSTKYGSVQVDLRGWKPWAMEFAPLLGSWLTEQPSQMSKFAGLDERLSLAQVLRQDLGLCKTAMDMFARYPALEAATRRFYGDNLLVDALLHHRELAVKQAEFKPAKASVLGDLLPQRSPATKVSHVLRGPAPVKQAAGPRVEIHVDEDAAITRNVTLNEKDREKLKRNGHLIKDHRDGEEVSKKYNTQVLMELTNPDASGIYEMLVKPQGFAKCLVISQPFGSEGQQDFSTVIRLEPKNWINAHRCTIYAKPQTENEDTNWAKWFAKQDKASLSVGGVYVIVGPTGHGTCPFRVAEDLGGDKYHVQWRDSASCDRPRYMPRIERGRDWDRDYYYGDKIISLSDREGTKFKAAGNILYVPSEHKILRVEKTQADIDEAKRKDKGPVLSSCADSSASKNPPLEPGNLADIQTEIMRKSAELRLYSNGDEISINRGPLMAKRSALFALVCNHGFREKEAREFLVQAEKSRIHGKTASFRVKYAAGYPSATSIPGPWVGPGPGAPAFNPPPMGADSAYGDIMSQYPQEETQPVPELSAYNTDPNTYNPLPQYMPPDPMAMQAAQQAGQQGQKEVFDTSMLSGLIRSSRQENMVTRYMGDLLKALDRLGRIIFCLYWHNDEFADRFGKAELPDLEDSLTNCFTSLGDTILWLTEKDVSPMPGLDFSSPGLQQAAEAM